MVGSCVRKHHGSACPWLVACEHEQQCAPPYVFGKGPKGLALCSDAWPQPCAVRYRGTRAVACKARPGVTASRCACAGTMVSTLATGSQRGWQEPQG